MQQQKDELEQKVFARTLDLEKLNTVLRTHENELAAKNLGLQTLLHSMEDGKKFLKEKTTSNFQQALLPLFDQLQNLPLSDRQQHIVDTINNILAELTSSMNYSLQQLRQPLTPTELKVVSCIKAGKSSKEIAVLFSCSNRTVEGHRSSIRHKLGLKRGDNLLSILLSLA